MKKKSRRQVLRDRGYKNQEALDLIALSPEGATHKWERFFYKETRHGWFRFDDGEWIRSSLVDTTIQRLKPL